MPARHLIIGGGTAGMNAIRTIREEERMRGADASAITLVSAFHYIWHAARIIDAPASTKAPL